MALTLVDRYRQLLAVVPVGDFYDSSGMVVPFRSTPYTIQVTVDNVNTLHQISINGVPVGVATSDGSAVITAAVNLSLGDNEIQFRDSLTGKTIVTYLTSRHYATWMAALAEVVGDVDVDLETTLAESRLATATSSLIGTVFGRPVYVQNDFNYGIEAYRLLLEQLRYAYRYYGGTNRGIEDVIRAFTQVSPLIFDRDEFGPLWVLGRDLFNPYLDMSKLSWVYGPLTRQPVGSPPVVTNIGAVAAGINVIRSGGLHRGDVVAVSATAGSIPTLSLAVNGAPVTSVITAPTAGIYRLPQRTAVPLISKPLFNTRSISALNRNLSISIGDRPFISFPVTTGATTAATIVADIQAALTASLSYGAPFTSYVRLYDPLAIGAHSRLGVELFQFTPGESVAVRLPSSDDLTQAEFGIPYVRAQVAAPGIAIADTGGALTVGPYLNAWPDVSVDEPIWVIFPVDAEFQANFDDPTFAAKVGGITSGYERIKIIGLDKTTGLFTIEGTFASAHDAGALVHLEGTDVVRMASDDEGRFIDIEISSPASITTGADTFTLGTAAAPGSGMPSGFLDISTTTTSPADPVRKHFDVDVNAIFGRTIPLGDAYEFTIPLTKEIMKYAGWPISVDIWYHSKWDYILTNIADRAVLNSAAVSFDVGTSSTTVVDHDVAESAANNRPTCSTVTFIVPPPATTGSITFTFGSAFSDKFIEIHKICAYIPQQSGYFLSSATIPHSEHTNKTGSLIYVWSPAALSSSEDQALGLTLTTQDVQGSIDRVAPAHASLQKFDISTYDLSGASTNLFGAFTDVDFVAGTSTNLTVVPLSPAKFSYLKPNQSSISTETVIFNPTGPFVYTLPLLATQNMLRSILTENGVPVTQDLWRYNSSTEIELLYTPLGAATYTFEYEVLHQFTTATLDLTASANVDRIYYFDYHVAERPENVLVEKLVTVPLSFDGAGLATLPEPSNRSKDGTTMIEDLGLLRANTISSSEWDFIDTKTIRINVSRLRSDALYTFTYASVSSHPNSDVEVKLEYRTGITPLALSSALYTEVTRGQLFYGSRYVQLRISIAGIRDINDAKIMALCLRQLSTLAGSTPVLT